MIHQLRIYEIFEQNKAAFHDRFRDHAARIMKSYGFDIIATWESKTNDRTEFVYLLAWPDEQTMRQAWEQFRANEEWNEIKRVTRASMANWLAQLRIAFSSRRNRVLRFPHPDSSEILRSGSPEATYQEFRSPSEALTRIETQLVLLYGGFDKLEPSFSTVNLRLYTQGQYELRVCVTKVHV